MVLLFYFRLLFFYNCHNFKLKFVIYIWNLLQLFEKTFVFSSVIWFSKNNWEILDPSKLNMNYCTTTLYFFFLLRKEVIHPHLPVGIPCYDLTPIINPTLDGSLHKWLGHRLWVLPTFVVWRAVCTRPENVFTAAFWSAITSDSNFMKSSCRLQSELRRVFWDSLTITSLLLFVHAIVVRV